MNYYICGFKSSVRDLFAQHVRPMAVAEQTNRASGKEAGGAIGPSQRAMRYEQVLSMGANEKKEDPGGGRRHTRTVAVTTTTPYEDGGSSSTGNQDASVVADLGTILLVGATHNETKYEVPPGEILL